MKMKILTKKKKNGELVRRKPRVLIERSNEGEKGQVRTEK